MHSRELEGTAQATLNTVGTRAKPTPQKGATGAAQHGDSTDKRQNSLHTARSTTHSPSGTLQGIAQCEGNTTPATPMGSTNPSPQGQSLGRETP